jgi:hypothetical protein
LILDWRSCRNILMNFLMFQHIFWPWVRFNDHFELHYIDCYISALDPRNKLDFYHESHDSDEFNWAKGVLLDAVSWLLSHMCYLLKIFTAISLNPMTRLLAHLPTHPHLQHLNHLNPVLLIYWDSSVSELEQSRAFHWRMRLISTLAVWRREQAF